MLKSILPLKVILKLDDPSFPDCPIYAPCFPAKFAFQEHSSSLELTKTMMNITSSTYVIYRLYENINVVKLKFYQI